MKWQSMFSGGDYITAEQLAGKDWTLTVREVKGVKLEGEDGKVRGKPAVYFREAEAGWVLCKTTAQCVGAMFGDDVREWVGKRVTIFATEVQVGREKKPGIRVKGSPDIGAPVTLEIKLPRKRPQKVTMLPTGKAKASAPKEPLPGTLQDAADELDAEVIDQ